MIQLNVRNEKVITASLLIVTMLFWSLGFGIFSNRVEAANLNDVKDTLSDSDLNVLATHVLQYTSGNAVTAGQTITVQFDPATQSFNLGTLATGDMSATGMTIVGSCGAGADEVTAAVNTGSDTVTFTACATDTVTAGAKTITFTNKITNPNAAGSYVVRLTSGTGEQADTRVAIIDDVVMSASVETNFTFAVAGLPGSTAINSDATTMATPSTATALDFGTLVPGAPKTLGQELAVTTNARNGFVVTVVQDQNLTSANGADVDVFKDGSGVAAPTVWTSPLNTLDQEQTYGHYGITSEDADLNTGEFTGTKYAGNIAAARQVFSHNGPSDGLTANKGKTRVGVKIQIGSLQEAASDYTNSLTYVATPVF